MAEIEPIPQGDTRDINIAIVDSDGDVFPVTGYTVLMTVKTSAEAATNLFTKTGTIIDGAAGEIQVALTATETTQTTASYYYFIVITNGASNIYTVKQGALSIITGA